MGVHGAPEEQELIHQTRLWLDDAWSEKSLLPIPLTMAKPHACDAVSSQRGQLFLSNSISYV